MKTQSIKQRLSLHASPREVYDSLMSSTKHSQFTGAPAKISRRVGGKFSAYDGYATGKNIELVKNKKIVQTWRASDWPEGIESELTIILTPTKTGCSILLTQKGVPTDQIDSIKQGWIDFYWHPMKEMFKNNKK